MIDTDLTDPAQAVPLTAGELDALLEGVKVEAMIGRGGMGAVFSGRQTRLDRPVAIKILASPDVGNPEFAERFRLEAQTLARLRHPNIVTVYDHGEIENFYYIVMELVDGTDLARIIEDGNMTPDQAIDLVGQICSALQYAHDEGIVHRDIKPANVLVDATGCARIADFGLAKILGNEGEGLLTANHERLGTPFYMAPEQQKIGGEIDHRSDIFSLGVVFYEMLTGEVPSGRFAPPSQRARRPFPARMDPVILKALESNPLNRYQSAKEFSDAIGQARHAWLPRRFAVACLIVSVAVIAAALLFSTGGFGRSESRAPDIGQREVQVEIIDGTGILLDDRFDNGTIVTNDRAGWTSTQAGKALALEPGAEGGVRWATGGPPLGFASLHCKNSFAIPENGDLTITWEISDLTSDGIGEWSYSVQLSVAALGFVASDTATFANIYEREAPTISIKLSIHPELDGVDFGVRYKDGSGKNEHAIHQHGPALNSQPITFSRWDTANNGRHEIWLRIGRDAIEAGWSGGPETVRKEWKDTSFSPPSPAALGSVVWPMLFAQNSASDVSGSHVVRRVTVQASTR